MPEGCERAPVPDLRPGDVAPIRFEKWGGAQHWTVDAVWLGADEHGWWAGWPDGTVWTRPGASFTSHGLQVGLFPPDQWTAATFYLPVSDYRYRVYADVATPPTWSEGAIRSVDLDLDVIHRFDGEVFVDDEDEFALHQVELGYPAEVVAAAERATARLVDQLRSGAAQFSETVADEWRGVLRRLLDAASQG